LLITFISNPKKVISGQEHEVVFESTMTIKSEPKPETELEPSLATEHIVLLSELPRVRNTSGILVSRGGITRDKKRYANATEVQIEHSSISSTEFSISEEERKLLEQ